MSSGGRTVRRERRQRSRWRARERSKGTPRPGRLAADRRSQQDGSLRAKPSFGARPQRDTRPSRNCAEKLAAQSGSASPSARSGASSPATMITRKKKTAHAAEQSRDRTSAEAARGLVRGTTRSRPERSSSLSTRLGPPPTWRARYGAAPLRPTAAGRRALWPLENDDFRWSCADGNRPRPFFSTGRSTSRRFEAYVDQVLVPELKPGDVVVMDNLSAHKGQASVDRAASAALGFCIFRPTVPTSIRSRTPSPNSRPSCARPLSEQFQTSGKPSPTPFAALPR